MSLDCYPFGGRRLIALGEQPMAIDAAYDDDLLVTVVDDCRTVVIFDLNQAAANQTRNLKVGHFQLGKNIVIDQVVHCKTGDYIACVGHKDGQLTLYAAFDWRNKSPSSSSSPGGDTGGQPAPPPPPQPRIEELDSSEMTIPLDEIDRSDKLISIDVCQETGNLAASYGDLVIIYRYIEPAQLGSCGPIGENEAGDVTQDSSWHEITSSPEDLALDLDRLLRSGSHFKHMVSVKLTIWAARVCLAENYLSIMSLDHVQVLKLELLTLQIQSEGQEAGGCQQQQQQQVSRSAGGSSGESQATAAMMAAARGTANRASKTGGAVAKLVNCPTATDVGQGQAGATTTSAINEDHDAEARDCSSSSASSSCSLASSAATGFSSSNQSLVTNFSSLLDGTGEGLLSGEQSGPNTTSTTGRNTTRDVGSGGGTANCEINETTSSQQLMSNIDSDMSIITMQNLTQHTGNATGSGEQQMGATTSCSQDDCITWNLNTKKLVKLPTLMHNTSTDLSSYHICHPLELLGPASESIACRVSARIYAPDLSQNQLEPVVLLCKQFDFDRDPIKLVQLAPVYLSHADDQRRLAGQRGTNSGSATSVPESTTTTMGAGLAVSGHLAPPCSPADSIAMPLLKSRDHELLASVGCFVATLANCYIYSLTGKKVTRLQTITFPGLCLDLRADLLNVYLLTPLGLQICSTSICDATFRYDWSSSADLNLSFLARDRVRALTTRNYLVMVGSSSSSSNSNSDSPVDAQSAGGGGGGGSLLEALRKPNLGELLERIGHTIQRCQSISIRSNLLTYLHASAQLCLIRLEKEQKRFVTCANTSESDDNSPQGLSSSFQLERQETIGKLKDIAILLAKQLLQKKQTNVITNSRIDRAIKHLMDISFCDLAELMQRHLAASGNVKSNSKAGFVHDASVEEEEDDDDDDDDDYAADPNKTLEEEEDDEEEDEEQPEDRDLELLTIYLRHSKFNQSILDYLKSTASPPVDDTCDAFDKLTSYMFDNNPRLLIKCAQRITRDGAEGLDNRCRKHLVDKLKQLAEFDSTGINRATVLFTLAILYYQSETSASEDSDTTNQQQQQQQQQQKQQKQQQQLCLQALGQIKPQNHLAITMCSNHEIIDQSMARLVKSHYPLVFKLFLSQLEKRGDLLAARQFKQLVEVLPPISKQQVATPDSSLVGDNDNLEDQHVVKKREEGGVEEEEEQEGEEQHEEDEDEVYERNLRLLAEVSPLELAELFCELSPQSDDLSETAVLLAEQDRQAMRALLKASVNLMESRYILARLSENSR